MLRLVTDTALFERNYGLENYGEESPCVGSLGFIYYAGDFDSDCTAATAETHDGEILGVLHPRQM